MGHKFSSASICFNCDLCFCSSSVSLFNLPCSDIPLRGRLPLLHEKMKKWDVMRADLSHVPSRACLALCASKKKQFLCSEKSFFLMWHQFNWDNSGFNDQILLSHRRKWCNLCELCLKRRALSETLARLDARMWDLWAKQTDKWRRRARRAKVGKRTALRATAGTERRR